MDYYGSTRFSHSVIGALRGLWRLIIFAVSFAGASTFAVLLRALLPTGVWRTLWTGYRRRAGRLLTVACGIRVLRQGRPPVAAALLASNHLSWADSFVYLGENGGRFIADHRYREVPVLGTVLSAVGVLFINRRSLRDVRTVGAKLERGMRHGEGFVVFPEADTSRGGGVLPFRPGLFEPAVRAGLPVGWAALRYETATGWPPASVVICWADWTPLILHMYRALYPTRTIAEIVYGKEAQVGKDRKSLAVAMGDWVASAFRPLPQPEDELLTRIHRPRR